ncbi:hypothetical protein HD806DRAFT_520005 [Xylariaceae sp. AK1471]|nr:hypothetical protein HD806DRAFT_520005 [Xylariaceae sp. AK1471]
MPSFLAQAQPQAQVHSFRPAPPPTQSMHSLSMTTTHHYDRETTNNPIGTPYATAPSPARQVLIRRLPAETTEERLKLMLLFSQELINIEILSADKSKDLGFCSAIVKFRTAAGAQQAKEMLHGKSIGPNDVELVVEIMSGSPPSSRRYPVETAISNQTSGPTPVTSSGAASRQSTRFNDAFQSLDRITPPSNRPHGSSELPDPVYPESSAQFQKMFSPQSPIGNHLTNHTHISGKTLIHDTAEDEETRELLKDPVAYAESGATHHDGAAQQRRATAPHLLLSSMSNLSLNTGTNGAAPLPSYAHSNMTPQSAHPNSMSPTMMNGGNHSMNFPMGPFHRHNFPPVNPADQNPPCNTLYVGNLPIDTSEEELKAMFSKQRGYKRLCFRTKQNGPMCFVEFENVTHATKALNELYGLPLHNSVKGGIRLSFSKNPLGVRSGQAAGPPANGSMASMNGLMATPGNGFASVNGPPPGLAAPPGLNRVNYNSNTQSMSNGTNTPSGYAGVNSHVWGTSSYAIPAVGSSSTPNGPSSAFQPSYMMGR